MSKDIISLLVIRDIFTVKSTIGRLYINGKSFCYTLEDAVRAFGIKIQNETAIPAGCYDISITPSNRFKRDMPLLNNVPMFTGIRIHGGNRAKDSAGCILVAYNKIDNDTIQGTAEKDLTEFLKRQKDRIVMTIVNKI